MKKQKKSAKIRKGGVLVTVKKFKAGAIASGGAPSSVSSTMMMKRRSAKGKGVKKHKSISGGGEMSSAMMMKKKSKKYKSMSVGAPQMSSTMMMKRVHRQVKHAGQAAKLRKTNSGFSDSAGVVRSVDKSMIGSLGQKYKKKSMKLGGGGRFAKLKNRLASKGARSPGALAAFIGRRKYGAKKFGKLSARG